MGSETRPLSFYSKQPSLLLNQCVQATLVYSNRHFPSSTVIIWYVRPQHCIKRASKNTWAAAMLIFSGVRSRARTAASLSCFTRAPTEPLSHTRSLSVLLSACRSDVSITFGIISCCLQAQCSSLHPLRQHLLQYVPVFSAMLCHGGTKQGAIIIWGEDTVTLSLTKLENWSKRY